MTERVEYQPIDTKRFHISEDEFSRERIGKIKEMYFELKKIIGDEIKIGFSLYGSLSKGKKLDSQSALQTDVDLQIYVDLDDLMRAIENLQGEKTSNKFLSFVLDHAQSISSEHLFSTSILRMSIEYFVNTFRRDEFPLKFDTDISVEFIRNGGEWSIMMASDILDDVIESGDEGNIESVSFSLAHYFALDVGGGLKPYRQKFFVELIQMDPERAQKKWSNLRQALFTERGKNLSFSEVPNEKIQKLYPPADYRQAAQYYGISI